MGEKAGVATWRLERDVDQTHQQMCPCRSIWLCEIIFRRSCQVETRRIQARL